jgi:hypothetical protein
MLVFGQIDIALMQTFCIILQLCNSITILNYSEKRKNHGKNSKPH